MKEILNSTFRQSTKPFFVGSSAITSSIIAKFIISGAFLFHELAQQIVLSNDLDNEMDELLQDIEIKCNRSILHSVLFY